MIEVPKEFFGRPEEFREYLDTQGLNQKQKLDLTQFRAPDINKGQPKALVWSLLKDERKITSPTSVRDSEPVVFSPRPFVQQQRVEVRWRGAGLRCPTPNLVCDSISASKSKCTGIGEFGGYISTPPRFYQTEFSTYDETQPRNCAHSSLGRDDHGNNTWSVGATVNCSPIQSGPGGDSYILDCPSGSHFNGHFTLGFVTPGTVFGIDVLSATHYHHHESLSGSHEKDSDITLLNEITTTQLETNTVDALPAYATNFDCVTPPALILGQGCTCSAYRNLSTDETSYSIRRFKYKFNFGLDSLSNPISVTKYLKIFWTERFTPTGGGSFTDTAKTWTHLATDAPATETDTHTVDEPSSNGTISIVNIRWSGKASYTPVIKDEGAPGSEGDCVPDTTDCTGHYRNCQ